jgi:hypothetical protein
VRTIFLYGRGTERFSQFDGELPDGLTFSSTRRDVHRVFGSPTLSAEPQVLEYLGPKGAWDRYDLPAAHIHFQYHRYQSGIEMITLMAPGTAP